MTRVDASRDLLEIGPTVAALNGARLSPVTVRAGQDARGASLELPPGRTGSDFVRGTSFRLRRFALRAAGAAAAGALVGCGDGGGTTAPATTGQPAPPPPVTAPRSPRWSPSAPRRPRCTKVTPRRSRSGMRRLASPSLGGFAFPRCPAPRSRPTSPGRTRWWKSRRGQGTTGTVTLDLAALADDQFDEGAETLSLRFAPDPTVNAQFGDDLPVSIREGGALVSFAAGGPDEPPLELPEGSGWTCRSATK